MGSRHFPARPPARPAVRRPHYDTRVRLSGRQLGHPAMGSACTIAARAARRARSPRRPWARGTASERSRRAAATCAPDPAASPPNSSRCARRAVRADRAARPRAARTRSDPARPARTHRARAWPPRSHRAPGPRRAAGTPRPRRSWRSDSRTGRAPARARRTPRRRRRRPAPPRGDLRGRRRAGSRSTVAAGTSAQKSRNARVKPARLARRFASFMPQGDQERADLHGIGLAVAAIQSA